MLAYLRHRLRDQSRFHPLTQSKRILFDRAHAVGNDDIIQGAAAGKGTLSDLAYALRQIHPHQRAAVHERVRPDFRSPIRYDDVRGPGIRTGHALHIFLPVLFVLYAPGA